MQGKEVATERRDHLRVHMRLLALKYPELIQELVRAAPEARPKRFEIALDLMCEAAMYAADDGQYVARLARREQVAATRYEEATRA